MASASDRKVFEDLAKRDPENKKCFDCAAANPQWVNTHHAIFICLDCSGIHRSLGTHLSFVRSISMDAWGSWKPEVLMRMRLGGNRAAREFFTKQQVPNPLVMGGDMREKIAARYNHLGAFKYRDRLDHLVDCKPWKEENFKPPATYDPNHGARAGAGAAAAAGGASAARGRITGMGSKRPSPPPAKAKKKKEEKPLAKGDNVMYTPPGGGPAVKGVIETVTFHEGTTSYMVALGDGRKRGARAEHLRRCGATLASALDILAEDSDDEEWAALVASGAIKVGQNIQTTIRSAAADAQRVLVAEEEVDLTALRELGERSGGKAQKGDAGGAVTFRQGERVVYHPTAGPPTAATVFAVDSRTEPPSYVLMLDDGAKRGAAHKQLRKWGAIGHRPSDGVGREEVRRAVDDEELQEDELGLLERFPVGTVVVAVELKAAAEMNGLRGKVVDISPDDNDRLMVDFGPEHGECALKPDNLQLVPKKYLQRLALVERGEAGGRTKLRQSARLEREELVRSEKLNREFLPQRLAFLEEETAARARVERHELGGRLFYVRRHSEETGRLWWHGYLRFIVPWLTWTSNLLGLMHDGKAAVPPLLKNALGDRVDCGHTELPPEAIESPEALQQWLEGRLQSDVGSAPEEGAAPAGAAAAAGPPDGPAPVAEDGPAPVAADAAPEGAAVPPPEGAAAAAVPAAPAGAAAAPAVSAEEQRLGTLRHRMQEWKDAWREKNGADPSKADVQGDDEMRAVYAEFKELQVVLREQRGLSQSQDRADVPVGGTPPLPPAAEAAAAVPPAPVAPQESHAGPAPSGAEPAPPAAAPAAEPPHPVVGVEVVAVAEVPPPAAAPPPPPEAAAPCAAATPPAAPAEPTPPAAPAEAPAPEPVVVAVEAVERPPAAPAAEQPRAEQAAEQQREEWAKEEALIQGLLKGDDEAADDKDPGDDLR